MPMNRAELLSSVIDETRRLFHRLANAADRAHTDLELTASQRAVVEALSRDGPQTVPQIARAKGVSRQHIQTIANGLVEEELIETRDNPAHQRSPLLALTSKGATCFQEVQEREQTILTELAQRFRLTDLDTTAQTLKAASQLLDQLNTEQGEDR
jgi:DNA-binding MarR family transcriptional regulator